MRSSRRSSSVRGRGVMDEKLRRAIGLADVCELMAAAWAFPTAELAAALADGAFADDAAAALEDAGAVGGEAAEAVSALRGLSRSGYGGAVEDSRVVECVEDPESANELFSALRKGYSLLFLAPGSQVPVFPYESAFRHCALGASGVPALFRSPVTLDVERQMRAAGVTPADARTEPADSVWNEFAFLSYGWGKVAEALEAGDADAEQKWRDVTTGFWRDHGALWLPAFMEKTIEEAAGLSEPAWGAPYRCFAGFGLQVCRLLAECVDREG